MWTGVEVVEADVCSEEGKARLRAADIVVLHNVFEFFGDAEAVGRGWAVVRECVNRKGQVLPALRPLPSRCSSRLRLEVLKCAGGVVSVC